MASSCQKVLKLKSILNFGDAICLSLVTLSGPWLSIADL
jgi:hypothetical protein